MKVMQVLILGLLLSSVIFVAYAADDSSSASAWLDAHSGEMLLLDYERD